MGTHPIFESDFDCLTEWFVHQKKNQVVKEIRKLQTSTDLLIRKAPFYRLVKEITDNLRGCPVGLRWQRLGLEALQAAAEAYLTGMFEQANLCALHAKRVTVMPKDMALIQRLKDMQLH